ncbi:uncharacterized protein [Euphorbia lathyris]|uniref:uncharacterized protein n=1 Tax=Euphorbia lathyris TaxID=212925 RepID=UPI00331445CC
MCIFFRFPSNRLCYCKPEDYRDRQREREATSKISLVRVDAAGGSPFVGSSNVVEGSPIVRSSSAAEAAPAARSSNVADCSTAVANSITGGGSPTAVNSVTGGVSPAAGNSMSSTNTAAPRWQAPRRRATLETPRDESGRFVVVLSSDYKIIDNHLATVISNIFEEYPQVVAYTYKSISKDVINQYWEEFQKKCVWNRSSYSNNVMKEAFIDKLKNRYKGILNDVRKAERQPVWCPDDVWQSWARMWSSPEFKRRSARAKKARGGKDGVPKGTHTGGSCSHAKNCKKKLEKEMNQPITPHQLFLWTHTHEHDGITFINDRSRHTQGYSPKERHVLVA